MSHTPAAAGREQAFGLRPYQIASLEAVWLAYTKGQNRVLMKQPTGTGKTVCFAAMLQHPSFRAWLETFPKNARKMLVIAHREELLDQAADKIQRANPGLMVSIEQGDRHANRYSDVVIASIQTLAARGFTRLLKLLQHHRFRLVIIDEAHHASASTYRTSLVHLGFLPPADASTTENIEAADFEDVAVMEQALSGWEAQAPKDQLLVGVTATPNRSDGVGLGAVFQTLAYSYALKQAIEDRWLVPIEPWAIETATSLDDVKISHGEFNQRDLADTVNTNRRNQLALAAWVEHARGLPTLAFTVDVKHAHALADTFVHAGVNARALSGETPKDERRQMLADFQARKIDLIANCMVLTEGTDLPLTECILHAKPTKSATLYEQMTGRGLRINPGKTRCVVLDLVDVARRHSLQASPVLYGLPPGIKTQGDDLRKIEGEMEALAEKYPGFDVAGALAHGTRTLAQLQAQASTFDVWAIHPVPFAGLSMDWIASGADVYRLQYPWGDGTETLIVQRDLLGKFDVSVTLRPLGPPGSAWASRPPARQRTLAASITDAKEALALAETFISTERPQVMRLKSSDAPWKAKPASEKQIALLRRRRIPFDEKTITMGQASQLIDLANARMGR